MATETNATAPPAPRSPWFGIGLSLIIVVVAVFFFFIATHMMLHRYHQGNLLNQPTTQPNSPANPSGP